MYSGESSAPISICISFNVYALIYCTAWGIITSIGMSCSIGMVMNRPDVYAQPGLDITKNAVAICIYIYYIIQNFRFLVHLVGGQLFHFTMWG